MKIGIITFHWGTNYGAVLQTYALQQKLVELGHKVYIINYRPSNYKVSLLSVFFTPRIWLWLNNFRKYNKEKKIELFRKKYLNETRLYSSQSELQNDPPQFDVYIAGSDQIWNPFFTTRGESRPTTAYFLNFGDKNIIRLGYAISFGCTEYPQRAIDIANKHVSYFSAISVREESGLKILQSIGYSGYTTRVVDPTLLLDANDYSFSFIKKDNSSKIKKCFFYILKLQEKKINELKEHMRALNYKIDYCGLNRDLTVEEWINNIKSSNFVITNSFHGVAFSIIFHKPFIAITADGISAGMNDRFYTLLKTLNLDSRIIQLNTDIKQIDYLLNKEIDWKEKDSLLSTLKNHSFDFIRKYCN